MMSQHHFGLFRGHLSRKLMSAIETRYPEVDVINYTEPRGEKRGWFCAPNRGEPFDSATARGVLDYARSIARGADLEKLGGGK